MIKVCIAKIRRHALNLYVVRDVLLVRDVLGQDQGPRQVSVMLRSRHVQLSNNA